MQGSLISRIWIAVIFLPVKMLNILNLTNFTEDSNFPSDKNMKADQEAHMKSTGENHVSELPSIAPSSEEANLPASMKQEQTETAIKVNFLFWQMPSLFILLYYSRVQVKLVHKLTPHLQGLRTNFSSFLARKLKLRSLKLLLVTNVIFVRVLLQ